MLVFLHSLANSECQRQTCGCQRSMHSFVAISASFFASSAGTLANAARNAWVQNSSMVMSCQISAKYMGVIAEDGGVSSKVSNATC